MTFSFTKSTDYSINLMLQNKITGMTNEEIGRLNWEFQEYQNSGESLQKTIVRLMQDFQTANTEKSKLGYTPNSGMGFLYSLEYSIYLYEDDDNIPGNGLQTYLNALKDFHNYFGNLSQEPNKKYISDTPLSADTINLALALNFKKSEPNFLGVTWSAIYEEQPKYGHPQTNMFKFQGVEGVKYDIYSTAILGALTTTGFDLFDQNGNCFDSSIDQGKNYSKISFTAPYTGVYYISEDWRSTYNYFVELQVDCHGDKGDELQHGDSTNNNDVIIGTENDDNILGLNGNDKLEGGLGGDRLDGGEGIDTLSGGDGDDFYIVDNIKDKIIELSFNDIDSVQSTVSYILGNNLENLELIGLYKINGTGNSLNNSLNGNSISNTLSGLAGNDTISGGVGSDKLTGGKGSDVFLFNYSDFFSPNSSGKIEFNKSMDIVTDFTLKDNDILDFGEMGTLVFYATLKAAIDDTAELFYVKGSGKIYLNVDITGEKYAATPIITLTGNPKVNVDLTEWNYPS
jgi:hypothetical protein